MPDSPVLFEELPGQDGNIGLITLNRPEALNALTHEMLLLIHQQLLLWEAMIAIKGVVIRATEGRAFCAGGDLRLAYEKHATKDPSLTQFFCDEYRLNHYIYHYSKPYIAFLDGIAMGGAAGISLHGSHCIGTERLLFAMPETGIGFFPDVGGSYFLSRLPQGMGFYLGLTGSRLSGDDCLALELIDYKISQSKLPLVLKALANSSFGEQPREAVSQILKPFHQAALNSPLMTHSTLINQHFVKPNVEELISALLANGESWCQETVTNLRMKSPTSLKVTLRQLQEGVKLDFDQCMQMEYQLMNHFTQGHDFFEGIRALIIEKDQAPHWQPLDLNDISQALIESYFKPFPGKDAHLSFT